MYGSSSVWQRTHSFHGKYLTVDFRSTGLKPLFLTDLALGHHCLLSCSLDLGALVDILPL